MCGSHGMRDLGRRELDHLWAGVRLGGVAGSTPPRGCGGAAECVGGGGIRGVRRGRGRPGDPGIREAFHTGAGDLGARIWGECAGSVGSLGRMGRIPLSAAEHDRSAEGGAGAQGGRAGGEKGEARDGGDEGKAREG